MNRKITLSDVKDSIIKKLARHCGVVPEEATEEQMYKATVLSVKDFLTQQRTEFQKEVKRQQGKTIYYLCMEFLMGRQLKNNLCNMGLAEQYRDILAEFGFNIEDLYVRDPDPGLGNGGLGRLAACFMDSLTSLNYPAYGFSICYDYGLFRQRIIDGEQIEMPDVWLPNGESWLVPRTEKTFTVRLGGHIEEKWNNGKLEIIHTDYQEIQAVPYDMMVSGAGSEACNVLRLWRARAAKTFNMGLFSQGAYLQSLEDNNAAEIISKVLYPSDNHAEGKLLRLTQQYFLVSASLQCIIADHLRRYGSLDNFADKVALHINDTHPALVVPELMRLLIDTYSYTWEEAWSVVTRTVSYTNHTVMPEALECWNEDLFRIKLPRIHALICEINRLFCADLWNAYPGDWDRISQMSIIGNGQVRMANLSIVGSHTVNGVAALHSEILKDKTFHNFYKFTPDKFTNVTNGIAHRRWLCYSNPELAALLDECIGSNYRMEPERLIDFAKYADDATVLARLREIKLHNKQRFAEFMKRRNGVTIDPNALFDVQVKRLHEYKRQQLNVLRIISLYLELKENPDLEMQPQTFIFGAKAAPGYYLAKQIIKLINYISADIEKNPKMREKLRVVFVEDYSVRVAECLIPAAEISEQISLAGKEASGTGNMKQMINGALTLGTMDGANVEIYQGVGEENMYLFGLTTPEVEEMWRNGYSSFSYYQASEKIKKVLDYLNVGFNGESFSEFFNYFVTAQGVPDPYLCLADFDSYCMAHDRALEDYSKPEVWNRKSLINIANAGFFAADRSIREYADRIWHIRPIHS